MGTFLKHLQVYKSSADFKRGSAYFNQFLEVIFLSNIGGWTDPKIQGNRLKKQTTKKNFHSTLCLPRWKWKTTIPEVLA